MNDSERALIERECTKLIVAYTHLIDFGEGARVVDLFTPDGVWESPENKMEGADAISAGFGTRQGMQRTSRHVCTNVAIDVVSADEATGVSYFSLYRHDGERKGPAPLDGPVMIGQYRDRFVRTADGWRIRQRHASATFMRR